MARPLWKKCLAVVLSAAILPWPAVPSWAGEPASADCLARVAELKVAALPAEKARAVADGFQHVAAPCPSQPAMELASIREQGARGAAIAAFLSKPLPALNDGEWDVMGSSITALKSELPLLADRLAKLEPSLKGLPDGDARSGLLEAFDTARKEAESLRGVAATLDLDARLTAISSPDGLAKLKLASNQARERLAGFMRAGKKEDVAGMMDGLDDLYDKAGFSGKSKAAAMTQLGIGVAAAGPAPQDATPDFVFAKVPRLTPDKILVPAADVAAPPDKKAAYGAALQRWAEAGQPAWSLFTAQLKQEGSAYTALSAVLPLGLPKQTNPLAELSVALVARGSADVYADALSRLPEVIAGLEARMQGAARRADAPSERELKAARALLEQARQSPQRAALKAQGKDDEDVLKGYASRLDALDKKLAERDGASKAGAALASRNYGAIADEILELVAQAPYRFGSPKPSARELEAYREWRERAAKELPEKWAEAEKAWAGLFQEDREPLGEKRAKAEKLLQLLKAVDGGGIDLTIVPPQDRARVADVKGDVGVFGQVFLKQAEQRGQKLAKADELLKGLSALGLTGDPEKDRGKLDAFFDNAASQALLAEAGEALPPAYASYAKARAAMRESKPVPEGEPTIEQAYWSLLVDQRRRATADPKEQLYLSHYELNLSLYEASCRGAGEKPAFCAAFEKHARPTGAQDLQAQQDLTDLGQDLLEKLPEVATLNRADASRRRMFDALRAMPPATREALKSRGVDVDGLLEREERKAMLDWAIAARDLGLVKDQAQWAALRDDVNRSLYGDGYVAAVTAQSRALRAELAKPELDRAKVAALLDGFENPNVLTRGFAAKVPSLMDPAKQARLSARDRQLRAEWEQRIRPLMERAAAEYGKSGAEEHKRAESLIRSALADVSRTEELVEAIGLAAALAPSLAVFDDRALRVGLDTTKVKIPPDLDDKEQRRDAQTLQMLLGYFQVEGDPRTAEVAAVVREKLLAELKGRVADSQEDHRRDQLVFSASDEVTDQLTELRKIVTSTDAALSKVPGVVPLTGAMRQLLRGFGQTIDDYFEDTAAVAALKPGPGLRVAPALAALKADTHASIYGANGWNDLTVSGWIIGERGKLTRKTEHPSAGPAEDPPRLDQPGRSLIGALMGGDKDTPAASVPKRRTVDVVHFSEGRDGDRDLRYMSVRGDYLEWEPRKQTVKENGKEVDVLASGALELRRDGKQVYALRPPTVEEAREGKTAVREVLDPKDPRVKAAKDVTVTRVAHKQGDGRWLHTDMAYGGDELRSYTNYYRGSRNYVQVDLVNHTHTVRNSDKMMTFSLNETNTGLAADARRRTYTYDAQGRSQLARTEYFEIVEMRREGGKIVAPRSVTAKVEVPDLNGLTVVRNQSMEGYSDYRMSTLGREELIALAARNKFKDGDAVSYDVNVSMFGADGKPRTSGQMEAEYLRLANRIAQLGFADPSAGLHANASLARMMQFFDGAANRRAGAFKLDDGTVVASLGTSYRVDRDGRVQVSQSWYDRANLRTATHQGPHLMYMTNLPKADQVQQVNEAGLPDDIRQRRQMIAEQALARLALGEDKGFVRIGKDGKLNGFMGYHDGRYGLQDMEFSAPKNAERNKDRKFVIWFDGKVDNIRQYVYINGVKVDRQDMSVVVGETNGRGNVHIRAGSWVGNKTRYELCPRMGMGETGCAVMGAITGGIVQGVTDPANILLSVGTLGMGGLASGLIRTGGTIAMNVGKGIQVGLRAANIGMMSYAAYGGAQASVQLARAVRSGDNDAIFNAGKELTAMVTGFVVGMKGDAHIAKMMGIKGVGGAKDGGGGAVKDAGSLKDVSSLPETAGKGDGVGSGDIPAVPDTGGGSRVTTDGPGNVRLEGDAGGSRSAPGDGAGSARSNGDGSGAATSRGNDTPGSGGARGGDGPGPSSPRGGESSGSGRPAGESPAGGGMRNADGSRGSPALEAAASRIQPLSGQARGMAADGVGRAAANVPGGGQGTNFFRGVAGNAPAKAPAGLDRGASAPVAVRDAAPAVVNDAAPTGVKDAAPAGVREAAPAAEASPATVREAAPVADAAPAAMREAAPVLEGPLFRDAAPEAVPAKLRDEAPASMREDAPTSARDEAPVSARDETPGSARDEAPAPDQLAAARLPAGAPEIAPAGMPDIPIRAADPAPAASGSEPSRPASGNALPAGAEAKTSFAAKVWQAAKLAARPEQLGEAIGRGDAKMGQSSARYQRLSKTLDTAGARLQRAMPTLAPVVLSAARGAAAFGRGVETIGLRVDQGLTLLKAGLSHVPGLGFLRGNRGIVYDFAAGRKLAPALEGGKPAMDVVPDPATGALVERARLQEAAPGIMPGLLVETGRLLQGRVDGGPRPPVGSELLSGGGGRARLDLETGRLLSGDGPLTAGQAEVRFETVDGVVESARVELHPDARAGPAAEVLLARARDQLAVHLDRAANPSLARAALSDALLGRDVQAEVVSGRDPLTGEAEVTLRWDRASKSFKLGAGEGAPAVRLLLEPAGDGVRLADAQPVGDAALPYAVRRALEGAFADGVIVKDAKFARALTPEERSGLSAEQADALHSQRLGEDGAPQLTEARGQARQRSRGARRAADDAARVIELAAAKLRPEPAADAAALARELTAAAGKADVGRLGWAQRRVDAAEARFNDLRAREGWTEAQVRAAEAEVAGGRRSAGVPDGLYDAVAARHHAVLELIAARVELAGAQTALIDLTARAKASGLDGRSILRRALERAERAASGREYHSLQTKTEYRRLGLETPVGSRTLALERVRARAREGKLPVGRENVAQNAGENTCVPATLADLFGQALGRPVALRDVQAAVVEILGKKAGDDFLRRVEERGMTPREMQTMIPRIAERFGLAREHVARGELFSRIAKGESVGVIVNDGLSGAHMVNFSNYHMVRDASGRTEAYVEMADPMVRVPDENGVMRTKVVPIRVRDAVELVRGRFLDGQGTAAGVVFKVPGAEAPAAVPKPTVLPKGPAGVPAVGSGGKRFVLEFLDGVALAPQLRQRLHDGVYKDHRTGGYTNKYLEAEADAILAGHDHALMVDGNSIGSMARALEAKFGTRVGQRLGDSVRDIWAQRARLAAEEAVGAENVTLIAKGGDELAFFVKGGKEAAESVALAVNRAGYETHQAQMHVYDALVDNFLQSVNAERVVYKSADDIPAAQREQLRKNAQEAWELIKDQAAADAARKALAKAQEAAREKGEPEPAAVELSPHAEREARTMLGTSSVGIAPLQALRAPMRTPRDSVFAALKLADRALEHSKTLGKGRLGSVDLDGNFSAHDGFTGPVRPAEAPRLDHKAPRDARAAMDELKKLSPEVYARYRELYEMDPISGVKDSMSIRQNLPELIGTKNRAGRYSHVLKFEVDLFKAVNDHPNLGHDVGDAVLAGAGKMAREAARTAGDVHVARAGGKEFHVLGDEAALARFKAELEAAAQGDPLMYEAAREYFKAEPTPDQVALVRKWVEEQATLLGKDKVRVGRVTAAAAKIDHSKARFPDQVYDHAVQEATARIESQKAAYAKKGVGSGRSEVDLAVEAKATFASWLKEKGGTASAETLTAFLKEAYPGKAADVKWALQVEGVLAKAHPQPKVLEAALRDWHESEVGISMREVVPAKELRGYVESLLAKPEFRKRLPAGKAPPAAGRDASLPLAVALPPLEPGLTLDGRPAAMSATFKVRRADGSTAYLKNPHYRGVESRGGNDAILREAEATAALSRELAGFDPHFQLPEVLGAGTIPRELSMKLVGKDNVAGLLLKPLEGRTIESYLDGELSLRPADGRPKLSAESFAVLERAMKRMHELGWAHGDVHMGNILFVEGSGPRKIGFIDFGTLHKRTGQGDAKFAAMKADDLARLAELKSQMLSEGFLEGGVVGVGAGHSRRRLLRELQRSRELPDALKNPAPAEMRDARRVAELARGHARDVAALFKVPPAKASAFVKLVLEGYPYKGYHGAAHPLEVAAPKLELLKRKGAEAVTKQDLVDLVAHLVHDSVGDVRVKVAGDIAQPPAVSETLRWLEQPAVREALEGLGLDARARREAALLVENTYFSDIVAEREAWGKRFSERLDRHFGGDAAAVASFKKRAGELADNDKGSTYFSDPSDVVARIYGLKAEQGKSTLAIFDGTAFFLKNILAKDAAFQARLDELGPQYRRRFEQSVDLAERFQGVMKLADGGPMPREEAQVVLERFLKERFGDDYRAHGMPPEWLEKELLAELVKPHELAGADVLLKQFREYQDRAARAGIARDTEAALDLFFESRNLYGAEGKAKLKQELLERLREPKGVGSGMTRAAELKGEERVFDLRRGVLELELGGPTAKLRVTRLADGAVVVDDGKLSRSFKAPEGRELVVRAGRADGADFVIKDPLVSRSHLELVIRDETVAVRDASSNGTGVRFEIGAVVGKHGHWIAGGRSTGRSAREVPIVDWTRDRQLNAFYDMILAEAGIKGRAGKLTGAERGQALHKVFDAVRKHVEYDADFANMLGDKYANQDVLLGDAVLKAGKGVCRHMGLLSSAVIERMIVEGYVGGKVYYVRPKGVPHGWAVYETSAGQMWVFDVAQKDHVVPMDGTTYAADEAGKRMLDYGESFPAGASAARRALGEKAEAVLDARRGMPAMRVPGGSPVVLEAGGERWVAMPESGGWSLQKVSGRGGRSRFAPSGETLRAGNAALSVLPDGGAMVVDNGGGVRLTRRLPPAEPAAPAPIGVGSGSETPFWRAVARDEAAAAARASGSYMLLTRPLPPAAEWSAELPVILSGEVKAVVAPAARREGWAAFFQGVRQNGWLASFKELVSSPWAAFRKLREDGSVTFSLTRDAGGTELVGMRRLKELGARVAALKTTETAAKPEPPAPSMEAFTKRKIVKSDGSPFPVGSDLLELAGSMLKIYPERGAPDSEIVAAVKAHGHSTVEHLRDAKYLQKRILEDNKKSATSFVDEAELAYAARRVGPELLSLLKRDLAAQEKLRGILAGTAGTKDFRFQFELDRPVGFGYVRKPNGKPAYAGRDVRRIEAAVYLHGRELRIRTVYPYVENHFQGH